MFTSSFFPSVYFEPTYWEKVGGQPPLPPVPPSANTPGGAIIYAVGVPNANYPANLAAYNAFAPVSVRSVNPTIFFYVGSSLPGATNWALTLNKPNGAIETITSNVYQGNVQPFTEAGIFQRGMYVVYVFGPGQIDQPGPWSVLATWTDLGGNTQTTGIGSFFITP